MSAQGSALRCLPFCVFSVQMCAVILLSGDERVVSVLRKGLFRSGGVFPSGFWSVAGLHSKFVFVWGKAAHPSPELLLWLFDAPIIEQHLTSTAKSVLFPAVTCPTEGPWFA
eukprot:RCo016578